MSISLQGNRTYRLCFDAMMTAFAMILSYLETLVPLQAFVALPGIRLGLANLAVMLVFALISPIDAAIVSAVRIFAMGLLFGSVTSLYFSAMGGLFSFLVLLLMRRVGRGCSYLGVSVLSAAAHNLGQMLAAVTLFDASLLTSYLPPLLFAALLCGSLVGMLLNLLLPRLQPLGRKYDL